MNEKRHAFKELTALSSRERGDEGGLSRFVEFYWAEIAIERSKGINKRQSLDGEECGA